MSTRRGCSSAALSGRLPVVVVELVGRRVVVVVAAGTVVDVGALVVVVVRSVVVVVGGDDHRNGFGRVRRNGTDLEVQHARPRNRTSIDAVDGACGTVRAPVAALRPTWS